MPNVEPRNLPIMPGPFGSQCSTSACVDIKATDAGTFSFTSTLGPDRGAVEYDRAELVQFFGDVKAGSWDHLLG